MRSTKNISYKGEKHLITHTKTIMLNFPRKCTAT